jgi:hypothetical protein
MASDTRPIEGAPRETRLLLGVLLAQRRTELGYTHVPAFVRARLPLTEKGNPNTRLAADIEKAYRDNFPEPRLRQLARAYLVDYDSLVAVAHGRAHALVPLSPAAPAVPVAAPAGGWVPPVTDPDSEVAIRPYFDPVNEHRIALAARGITAPSGAQMFGEGTEDAMTWDGVGARLEIRDRVWLIAELRRNADRRASPPETGANGR